MILVTGGDGQVGRALARLGARALPRAALDVTDAAAVSRALDGATAVVHAAAYTAVDRAEEDAARAFAVNEGGAANMARAAAARGLPLVHLSTDYVFDGEKDGGYDEDDAIAPLSVYGASKAAGEVAVRAAHPRAVILRTSWVFSADGTNFVKTMVRLGRERETLRVVDDQRGGPTPADAIAAACLALVEKRAAGTFHLAGEPAITWHGFAAEILDGVRARGVAVATRELVAVSSAAYGAAARRPPSSVLRCERIAALGIARPDWRPALARVLDALCTV